MGTLGSGFGGGYYGVSGLCYRTIKPFTKVERHWTNLIFTGANLTSPGGTIAFNPVVDKEYTTLTDAAGNNLKMSAKTFQYDFNGNVAQTTEYDWFDPALVSRDANGVPTGLPGSATVLRTTNNSYYNAATTASSGNVYAKRATATGIPLILNATQQTTVGPSIVQLSYDGQAYGTAPTIGNLTTKKVWVDLESKWITTSNTYGLYGNIATSTDGLGKVTQFFYDDATHALPNRVSVDPQNGTGTQTSTTAYDISTGVVTSQTDANGQVSTIDYTNQLLGTVDPFSRPGITKTPQVNIGGTNHRQRVTTTYLDSARQVIVATDLTAENDKIRKTKTTSDPLGRPVLTEQTEDGINYTISVKNAYLDMGRVTLTSSAMRSTAASTDSWTRVTKDAAGRVIQSATFSGATQPAWTGTSGVFTGATTTTYDANFTTVTGQAGKVRRSMVDALGRLRRVDEPDAAGSLGTTASPVQPTSYAYDVFGNLTTITQGTQTRTFTYDSLFRQRTTVNPESGTANYQYDDNGNLVVKTDARGVSTHFAYDSMNRITRRWYNGSNLVTSPTHNVPALPAGVAATDEVKFYYDTQSLPAGAPTYTRGSAVGRLVARTYGTGSNGDYYAFDVLGRQTLKISRWAQ
jgi:YD repeat-containing protein